MTTREIILDTETTGLSPKDGHRIIEIGAVEMINKVLTGQKFHFYINPERDVPAEAYRIHGISSEFLRDKPLFKDIAKEFASFIEDGKLVIHNAAFDVKFLNHEFSLIGMSSIELSEAIDTLAIARKMFPGARANLDALCKRFKVDNSSRDYHGALKDAELLAQVYVELSGGRQESFLITKNNNVEKSDFVNLKTNVKGNKIVIMPTEEEKQNHQKFMEKFL
jgi:DNA polymerase III subunit epsilon